MPPPPCRTRRDRLSRGAGDANADDASSLLKEAGRPTRVALAVADTELGGNVGADADVAHFPSRISHNDEDDDVDDEDDSVDTEDDVEDAWGNIL